MKSTKAAPQLGRMTRRALFAGASAVALMLSAGGALAQNVSGELVLLNWAAGSEEELIKALEDGFVKANPGVNISLSGGGSGEGIKALIDKSADIANSSREIKGNEVELAKSKGVNPVETIVAVDAIVPIRIFI